MSPYQTSFLIVFLLVTLTSSVFFPVSADDQTITGNSTGNKSDPGFSEEGKNLILPEVITSPGVYILPADYSAMNSSDAITICSDDVILLGRGHTLQGNISSSDLNTGIRVSGSGEPFKNITISSMAVTGFHSGLLMERTEDADIEDCSFHNNHEAGISLINVTAVTINGTTLSANHPPDTTPGGSGIIITDSDNVTIRTSQVIGSGQGGMGSGIHLIRSSGISIERTTITTSATAGITVEGLNKGLIIRDTIITANNGNGITLGEGCTGPQISGSRISENTQTGLEITSCSLGFLIGNNIDQNRVGLSLSDSETFSLSSNEFRKNKLNLDITGSTPARYQHHIDTSNLADGRPVWYLCDSHGKTIGSSDNPSCVYAVNCSNLTISDLIFSNNGAGIFLINSDLITISRVASLDNTFGIRIGYGSRNISISECSAETNLLAGYALSSSEDVTFRSCSAQNNLIGFFCTSSNDLIFESCNAYKQQGLRRRGPSGFLISGCSHVSLVNTSADQNQFDGIYLKDTPNTTIKDTTLSSNDIAGIAVFSEGVQIRNTSVTNNGAGGVLIYGNSTSIQDNQITGNKGRGLIIDGVSGSRIWNNFFNNSRNVEMTGTSQMTVWNITPSSGQTIIGSPMTGGNFWGAPNLSGDSDMCNPDVDGFCSSPYRPGTDGIDYHPLTRNKYQNESAVTGQLTTLSISENRWDLDHNGRVNLQDVIVLMDGISSGEMTSLTYDFSQDGRVNLNDVIVFFHLISGT